MIFKKAYKEKGDKIVLDYYKPKTGLYIRINKNGSRDYLTIEKDSIEDELYSWFKERDYYSSLLSMNKPIDPKKKIHSNNYYTIFMKKDIFPGIGKNELKVKDFEERVIAYFEILENPNYRNDKRTSELLNKLETPPDVNVIAENKKYILDNIENLTEKIKAHEFDGYISIFFDASLEEYVREYKRYILPRVFNKNDYNVNIDGEIWGLSNSNMGTNAKKPYLENKTMKCVVPYRVKVDDAILIKKFFDWLNYKREKDMAIPYDYSFEGEETEIYKKDRSKSHILRIGRAKEGEIITDYEFVPFFTTKINFQFENILQTTKKIKEVQSLVDYGHIVKRYELEQKADEIFFNKKMTDNYYGDIKSNMSNNLKNLLFISRSAFNNYFRKGIDDSLKDIIEGVGREIVKEHLIDADGLFIKKAIDAFNLWISILKFLEVGGEEMADKLKDLIKVLEEKGNEENLAVCESDEEFYFAAGQLAYFLLSQSEASKLTHGVTEPFLRANTADELKRQLRNIYEQYNHGISFNNKRFNQIFAMVMGYETKERMKKLEDIFLAGFMAKNLFYTPITQKSEREEKK